MKCSTARWLLFCRVSAITSGCIDRVIHFIFLHWLHRCLAGWTAQSTGLDRRTACAVSWLTGAVTWLQSQGDRLAWQPRSIVQCLHFPTLTFEFPYPQSNFRNLDCVPRLSHHSVSPDDLFQMLPPSLQKISYRHPSLLFLSVRVVPNIFDHLLHLMHFASPLLTIWPVMFEYLYLLTYNRDNHQ